MAEETGCLHCIVFARGRGIEIDATTTDAREGGVRDGDWLGP